VIIKRTMAGCTEPVTNQDGSWHLSRFFWVERIDIPHENIIEYGSRGGWVERCRTLLMDDLVAWCRTMPPVQDWLDNTPVFEKIDDVENNKTRLRLRARGTFALTDNEQATNAMLLLIDNPVEVMDTLRDVVVFG